MYIKKTTMKRGEKIYTYATMVQAYRVGATIKHRTIARLGRVDKPLATLVLPLIEKQQVMAVSHANPAKLYALPMAIHGLWKDMGLSDTITGALQNGQVTTPVSLLAELMTMGRILHPDSKLSLTRYYASWYLPESLPKSIDVHAFYRSLDYLMEQKETIEKHLLQKMKEKQLIAGSLLFYDLTSSYFEGEDCPIAMYGYSRDHRGDRIQITLGLVLDSSGLPLYHEVFAGNMLDQKTVTSIIEKLSSTFSFSNILFVADKGMLSDDNIKTITEHGYDYIISQSPRTDYEQNKEALTQKATWTKYTPTLFFSKAENGDILCYNPHTAKKATATRKRKLAELTEYIAAEQAKETQPKRKQTKEAIHDRIIRKLQKSHTTKYFDTKNNFTKKQEVIDKEQVLDGVWILKSSKQAFTPEEIISSYKQEARIESAFKVIKDVIHLRPIYHYNAEHVKGHVFICVLAYLVTKLLEQKTGETIKTLREKYMTAVIVQSKKATEPDMIVGGKTLLQQCGIPL
jgi:transposase